MEEVPLKERLEDIEDFVDLRAAKDAEHGAPTVTLAELEQRFDDAN
jgi:hypothetical protein